MAFWPRNPNSKVNNACQLKFETVFNNENKIAYEVQQKNHKASTYVDNIQEIKQIYWSVGLISFILIQSNLIISKVYAMAINGHFDHLKIHYQCK